MATKDVERLQNKGKPMLRQMSTEENVHELLVLLRSQEEAPDEVLLNETKCLLSLSLDKNTMPPLPSINTKKTNRQSSEEGRKFDNVHKATRKEESSEINSEDEVSDASQTATFTPVSSAKKRLPSLGSTDEGTGKTNTTKTWSQSRRIK